MQVVGADYRLGAGVRAVATIGVYDGVHRGHQWLLRRLGKAGGPDATVVVVTFDPHPLSVTRPVAAPRTLTTLARKLEILSGLGMVDVCMVVPFDAGRRDQRALEFIDDVLVERLHVGTVMVGADFRFGRDREGDVALLQTAGGVRGFSAYGAPLYPAGPMSSSAPCSSTMIRKLIRRGDVHAAAGLLGRAHQVAGTVSGISRPRGGRGVPTAVIRVDREVALPIEGSYLGRLIFPDHRDYVAGLSVRQGLVAGPDAIVDAHVGGEFRATIGDTVSIEFTRPLWASDRGQLASEVATRADELGRARAAGGWGVVR